LTRRRGAEGYKDEGGERGVVVRPAGWLSEEASGC